MDKCKMKTSVIKGKSKGETAPTLVIRDCKMKCFMFLSYKNVGLPKFA